MNLLVGQMVKPFTPLRHTLGAAGRTRTGIDPLTLTGFGIRGDTAAKLEQPARIELASVA